MNTAKLPKLPSEWPVLLLALPAFVAIWGGWVGLGELTGFGPVNLLPGIGTGWTVNTAITLPVGVEAYAAYALRVWLSDKKYSALTRTFAMWSAIGSLALGMAGQAAYHLMKAAGWTVAPWQITTFVSCLPVVVLGCGAALAHLCTRRADAVEEVAEELPAEPARTPNVPARPDPSVGQEPAVSVTPYIPDPVTETAPAGGQPPRAARPSARATARPAATPPPRRQTRQPAAGSLSAEDLDLIARLRAARDPQTGELPKVLWMRQAYGIGQGRAARLREAAARPDLHTVKNEEVAVG